MTTPPSRCWTRLAIAGHGDGARRHVTPASSGTSAAQPRNTTKKTTAIDRAECGSRAADRRRHASGPAGRTSARSCRILRCRFRAPARRCDDLGRGPIIFGRPSSSTSSRSATRRPRAMRDDDDRRAARAGRRRRADQCRFPHWSRKALGSSSTSTVGSPYSARASAMRCA